jgi:hypothetical protein
MEKPIRIGPLCGARVVPAVEVSCGSFTQDAAKSRHTALRLSADTFLIVLSFTAAEALLYQTHAVEVEQRDYNIAS